jgi:hypothetical protein
MPCLRSLIHPFDSETDCDLFKETWPSFDNIFRRHSHFKIKRGGDYDKAERDYVFAVFILENCGFLLELLLALNGLKSFTSQVSHLSPRVMLDNFTVVHYINKSGGTKSPAFSANSADIFAWCESHNLSIEAIHLPRVLKVQRLKASKIDFPAQSNTLRTEDKPIRLVMELTAGSFCQLKSSAGSYDSPCFLPELDQSERICISSGQHDRQMFDGNHEGEGRFNSIGTGLASATVVANHHGTSLATLADNSST